MAAIRSLLGGFVLLAAALGTAAAHRTPEVHITAEIIEIGGEQRTALTVRMETEDALALGEEKIGTGFTLDDEAVMRALARHAAFAIDGSAPLDVLGGEVEADRSFFYLEGPADFELEKASVLSSVYLHWTNYFEDKRQAALPTRMFTQDGRIPPHRH
jgi:hypothetical protein